MNDYMASQLNASRQAALAAKAERHRLIREARTALQAPVGDPPVRRVGALRRAFRRYLPSTA